MVVKLISPHTLDGDRCSDCLAPVVRWEQEGPCKPIIFYIRQDPSSSEFTARSPQLGIEVAAHSSRHLQPVIMKAMDTYFNEQLGELLAILKGLGLALEEGVDPKAITTEARWDVPYQTKRQQH